MEKAEIQKKFENAKKETVSIVAQKLNLDEGEYAFLKYMYTENIPKSDVVESPFDAHVFFDAVQDSYVSIAGVALDKVEWEENRYYKITFNGELKTQKSQPFNAWIVESLAKDFKL